MAEPAGVLARIAASKKRELESRFDGVAIEALRSRAGLTRRSLATTLAKPGARFILEIKKASPSAGDIRRNADPAALARGYAGVADALSVLCDGPYFGGSLQDLAAAREEFEGPILAKDFFIDPRQVVEARMAGADAVLVMLSLLDNDRAREIIEEASRFGMDSLVEVHDEEEMQRACALGCPLVGINNRDLRDLTIDLATTERLARRAPDCILISESGIGTGADVERLGPLVDGFLIGSSLMLADEPAQAARELMFGRTKLCGLNSGAALCAARPAAFAGFVFVPGSPRHVTAQEAAPLAGVARRSGMLPVGIFADASLRIVADMATLLNLHAVQLHGHEGPDYVAALARQLPSSCEIWTALGVGREPLVSRGGKRLVFDNGSGGSGRSFDWSLVERHPELPTALVAGGIGAHNARAARKLGAFAIDVGSMVDARPGLKSPEKIEALFDSLRAPDRQRIRECV